MVVLTYHSIYNLLFNIFWICTCIISFTDLKLEIGNQISSEDSSQLELGRLLFTVTMFRIYSIHFS